MRCPPNTLQTYPHCAKGGVHRMLFIFAIFLSTQYTVCINMQLFTDFLIFEMFLVRLLDNKREKITLRLAEEIKI